MQYEFRNRDMCLQSSIFQGKLRKLKSGLTMAEKEIAKYDVELEEAVPADMSMFEEEIAVSKASASVKEGHLSNQITSNRGKKPSKRAW